MRPILTAVLMLGTAATAYAQSSAQAPSYPSKPIRMIIPYAPGGGTDAIIRPLVPSLTQSLGTQLVLENRGGAGTIIGADIVAKAPADGYTLLVCGNASHAISPQIYSKAPYDAIKDFEPVTLLGTSPTVLFAYTNFPINTVAQLVESAKANPGKFSYVTSGVGTAPHLSTEIFMSMAGIKLLHVPYKGGGDALGDMIAGRVDLKFGSAPEAIPPVKSGRLKAIAITLDTRWPELPAVPTFAESGWPQYKTGTWYGLCAPAKTPKPVIDSLYKAVHNALASGELRDKMASLGATPGGGPPKEFAIFIRNEYETYGKVIKALNLRLE